MKRFSAVLSPSALALLDPLSLTASLLQRRHFLRNTTFPRATATNGTTGIGGDVHDTEETHPDFQPRVINSDIAEDEVAMVKQDINDTIKTEAVVVFIKGVPEAPMCAFSRRMIDILEALGLEYTSFDVLAHPVVRTHVKGVSEWPTVPQLFLMGEFVGGLDVIQKMLESKDLQKLLEQKKIGYRDTL